MVSKAKLLNGVAVKYSSILSVPIQISYLLQKAGSGLRGPFKK